MSLALAPCTALRSRRRNCPSRPQPEMEEFPKCKFAFMALMDVAQVIIVMISGGVIPAPLTVLLLQSLIPATMVASRLFLGNRYRWRRSAS